MPTPDDRPGPGEERVTAGLLSAWPLPGPPDDGDKHDRGLVVVIGGSAQVPGAVLLAGMAALRAGAGKLRLATAASAALPLAMAVPEAMVVGLAEAGPDSLAAWAGPAAAGLVDRARAVVVGPGTTAGPSVSALAQAVAEQVTAAGGDGDAGPVLVIDAGAIAWLAEPRATGRLAGIGGRVVVTPNPDEMARCFDCDPRELAADPAAVARRAAGQWGVVVTLKGPATVTATPDGRCFVDDAGNPGLATSGSGDVAAGVIGGLAARGASALQAAVWGAHVHARAGDRLARQVGRLGYLARELVDAVPAVLDDLDP